MIALRMGKNKISHEHYVDAIAEVQAKKKGMLFQALSMTRMLMDLQTLSTSTHSGRWHLGSCAWPVGEPCNHRDELVLVVEGFRRSP